MYTRIDIDKNEVLMGQVVKRYSDTLHHDLDHSEDINEILHKNALFIVYY